MCLSGTALIWTWKVFVDKVQFNTSAVHVEWEMILSCLIASNGNTIFIILFVVLVDPRIVGYVTGNGYMDIPSGDHLHGRYHGVQERSCLCFTG